MCQELCVLRNGSDEAQTNNDYNAARSVQIMNEHTGVLYRAIRSADRKMGHWHLLFLRHLVIHSVHFTYLKDPHVIRAQSWHYQRPEGASGIPENKNSTHDFLASI